MHLMFGRAERDAEEGGYDPYWKLYGIAPRLVDEVRQKLRKFGVLSPDEAFQLDTATAGALTDRLLSGEIATAESLRNVPPELAAIWGVHELIRSGTMTRPNEYPPEPILWLPGLSASVRYSVSFTRFLEKRTGEYTDFQLHAARRSNNLYNGTSVDQTVQCLVALRTADNLLYALPLPTIQGHNLIEVATTTVEAQGDQDLTVYN